MVEYIMPWMEILKVARKPPYVSDKHWREWHANSVKWCIKMSKTKSVSGGQTRVNRGFPALDNFGTGKGRKLANHIEHLNNLYHDGHNDSAGRHGNMLVASRFLTVNGGKHGNYRREVLKKIFPDYTHRSSWKGSYPEEDDEWRELPKKPGSIWSKD